MTSARASYTFIVIAARNGRELCQALDGKLMRHEEYIHKATTTAV